MSDLEALPAPLTPPDCDLQDFAFMPVDVRRLLKSETWALASGEQRAAATALWFESWHQVPAASLPSSDGLQARLADAPRWAKVKEQALRGWTLCSDGRLYHPVVAEKALEAWIEKLLALISGAHGNAKRWKIAVDTSADAARLRVAIDLLGRLQPKSRTLRKKAVLQILCPSAPDAESEGGASPPESGSQSGVESPPDSAPESAPDSDPDRNRQGHRQGQGLKKNPAGSSVVRKRGAHFVPDDFTVTPEMVQWAADHAPHASLEHQTAVFREWEFTKPRTDWGKTWRTWMLKASAEAETSGRRPSGAAHGVNRQEALEQRNRQIGEQWAAEGDPHATQ